MKTLAQPYYFYSLQYHEYIPFIQGFIRRAVTACMISETILNYTKTKCHFRISNSTRTVWG